MKLSFRLAWVAGILAVAVPGTASAQAARKPVVAVTHMKDLASTGQGPALETMIQTAITEGGKFRVIERNFGELDAEQALARSGKVTTNTPGANGGYEGVDYIVYGTITSASAGRRSDDGANIGLGAAGRILGLGGLGGGGCSKIVSSLAVDIKIVDSKTGEVTYAKQINQHTATKTSCSGDPGLDVTALMRDVANQTATGLATTIYPIKVAGVQPDGTVVLNGEGAVTPDMILVVEGAGGSTGFRDPDTGALLNTGGESIGLLRVSEVDTRFSKALPYSDFTAPPSAGTIVRVATPADLAKFPVGKAKKGR